MSATDLSSVNSRASTGDDSTPTRPETAALPSSPPTMLARTYGRPPRASRRTAAEGARGCSTASVGRSQCIPFTASSVSSIGGAAPVLAGQALDDGLLLNHAGAGRRLHRHVRGRRPRSHATHRPGAYVMTKEAVRGLSGLAAVRPSGH